MGEKSAKKVRGHGDLTPGETVADACYGLGKGVLAAADQVRAPGIRRYSKQAELATDAPAGSMAAAINRPGILAVTDQRLLFLPVKTAITKPKAVAAAWPLAQVLGAAYDSPMLSIAFADGSVGALHLPTAEKPDDFVAHVNRLVGPPPPPAAG